ncbi:amidohydrolase family protein [Gordonia sp. DT219]|uniref:amidohydrolase family protein n=1 Tax=Gordonia sp. DT219 TaxID=3416658 RepID=UPI003CFACE87
MTTIVRIRPARSTVTPPRHPVPHGAWDTHAHVFGPRELFPQSPTRSYVAPTQGVDRYLGVLDALGIRHGVLVQPSVYHQDNSCLLAALDEAPDRLVGVVDVDVLDTPDDVLHSMTRRGVVGLRVQWPGNHSVDRLRATADRLAELGWHLDLRVAGARALTDLAPVLAASPVPVMIESMGSPRAGESLQSSGFRSLFDLLTEPGRYVKLSHVYQVDASGPPYRGATPFARALIEHAPDRLVWGSDWPHPMPPDEFLPDDGALVDLVPHWTGDADTTRLILRDNPFRFYRPRSQGGLS